MFCLRSLPFSACLICACAMQAQNPATPAPAPTSAPDAAVAPHTTETVVVLGSGTPVPLAESPASVTVLTVTNEELLELASEQQLLREDSSVSLEQRGAGGGQADIVLRGGTFEQTLVLLNGFRINDSQTSHHNLDLPIPMDAMDSVEVLHGAGSTLHGTDALSGVVDFITAAPSVSSLRLRAGDGSFGANEESVVGALVTKPWSGRVTAGRDFSTGFATDRDYRNQDASLESWSGTRLGVTDLLFAASDRSFGANQFYGPYNSWERTKGWFASARQQLGSKMDAAFGYRRHTDEFVLLRTAPAVYENNHMDGSWEASLRRTQTVTKTSILLFGLEADGDSIQSYNVYEGFASYALGIHARNRGAGYVDLDLKPAKARWNLSVGAREEVLSGGGRAVFSPHLAGSLRLTDKLKLRASGGYGFRIPTYTDLYYSDPTTVGNANLKPESAWSGEGGADWNASAKFSVSATAFYNRDHATIDYVRNSPTAQWQAVNLNGLRFVGVESSVTWVPAQGQRVQASWTALSGVQHSLNGLQSEYALNYPLENLHGSWTAALGHAVTVMNEVRMVRPSQQAGIAAFNATPYPVWNASVTHDAGRVRPYLRLENLSNTGYQEIRSVAMPGRSITGGVTLWLSR